MDSYPQTNHPLDIWDILILKHYTLSFLFSMDAIFLTFDFKTSVKLQN